MSQSPDDFPSLKPGGHVCLPYAGEAEKHSAIAGFIHDGLVRGERCLYWGSKSGFLALVPHLEARGIPARALCERATLVFVDAAEPAEAAGGLDRHLASIRDAALAARAEGYAGLRVAGDPDQATRAGQSREQLAAFESSLARLLGDAHATGLCTFDRRTADAAILEVALATHAIAIVDGRVCDNPYFQAPDQPPGRLLGQERVAGMAANIRASAEAHALLDAENAALIVQNTLAGKREAAYRQRIAALARSIEARDRLLVTTARWLGRPLPALCGHIEDLSKDEHLSRFHQAITACGEHLAAILRLSHGLDEIAGFLQMQVVLRPERLDLVEVARVAIAEILQGDASGQVEIALEGAAEVAGTWDRLRLVRLFHSLIRTAREQGYDAHVNLRIEDLVQFARLRFEFMLPYSPALSDSGERARTLPYGPSGESDYERLAVHTWSAREIVRLMGGSLGISTWADARVVFTLDLPKTAAESPRADESDGS
ncbi:MAG: MEDS domain-containing protein [Deltaproteobacteria bacterium]|nr:MEDS domain-containing protein [Deltaproteobacteria bacterium]